MMNNEPVAWYNADDSSLSFKNHGGGWEPLYTHPANKKVEKNTDLYEKVCNCTKKLDLTDEEIDAVWFSYKGDIKDFAKAILKKASEK